MYLGQLLFYLLCQTLQSYSKTISNLGLFCEGLKVNCSIDATHIKCIAVSFSLVSPIGSTSQFVLKEEKQMLLLKVLHLPPVKGRPDSEL